MEGTDVGTKFMGHLKVAVLSSDLCCRYSNIFINDLSLFLFLIIY
jgi:hypothetical protein